MPDIPASSVATVATASSSAPGVNWPTGLTRTPPTAAALAAPLGVLAGVAVAEGFTPTPPGVPQRVWLRPDGTGELRLSWLANSEGDLDHYEYRYGTTDPPAGAPVTVQPTLLLPGTESTVISGTSNGTTYHAQVRAVDLDGNNGDWSASVSAAGSVLGIVQAKAASSGPAGTTATVTLDATPTDGNLLVTFVATTQTNGADIPAPTGHTGIGSVGTNNVRCAAFYKVCSGESAAVTSDPLTSGDWGIAVVEITGQDATPIDASIFEQAMALGPTSATAQADELALSFWYTNDLNRGQIGGTAGWTPIFDHWNLRFVARFLTATGAQSDTVTTAAGTAAEAGGIVTVKS